MASDQNRRVNLDLCYKHPCPEKDKFYENYPKVAFNFGFTINLTFHAAYPNTKESCVDLFFDNKCVYLLHKAPLDESFPIPFPYCPFCLKSSAQLMVS